MSGSRPGSAADTGPSRPVRWAAAAAVADCYLLGVGWTSRLTPGMQASSCGVDRHLGREPRQPTSGRKDPGHVVVDEVVGQWITLAGATAFELEDRGSGLPLFRLFDIWKPPPARQLEALPGGVGIMADDVMAGVYGALCCIWQGCFLSSTDMARRQSTETALPKSCK